MSRSAVKARLCPLIVNTRRATTTAVARFGPPPATAAHEPLHCVGTWLRKGGINRVIMALTDHREAVVHAVETARDRAGRPLNLTFLYYWMRYSGFSRNAAQHANGSMCSTSRRRPS